MAEIKTQDELVAEVLANFPRADGKFTVEDLQNVLSNIAESLIFVRRIPTAVTLPVQPISAAQMQDNLVLVNEGANREIVLPQATAELVGRSLPVFNVGPNTLQVTLTAPDIIDGQTFIDRTANVVYAAIEVGKWVTVATPATLPEPIEPFAFAQVFEFDSGTVTPLLDNVWAALNSTLALNGSPENFSVAGNVVTYTGADPIDVIATCIVSGAPDSGSNKQFDIGVSLNGADPTMRMRNRVQSSSTTGEEAWSVEAALSLTNGDTLTPFVRNPNDATDFLVCDVILTVLERR